MNAEDEPGTYDYPKDPEFRKKYGPRGVIKSTADGRIEGTAPLTRRRMETIDEEILAGTLDFTERAKKADKPFFLWHNSTRMHVWTRLKKREPGQDRYRFVSRRDGGARRSRRGVSPFFPHVEMQGDFWIWTDVPRPRAAAAECRVERIVTAGRGVGQRLC